MLLHLFVFLGSAEFTCDSGINPEAFHWLIIPPVNHRVRTKDQNQFLRSVLNLSSEAELFV